MFFVAPRYFLVVMKLKFVRPSVQVRRGDDTQILGHTLIRRRVGRGKPGGVVSNAGSLETLGEIASLRHFTGQLKQNADNGSGNIIE